MHPELQVAQIDDVSEQIAAFFAVRNAVRLQALRERADLSGNIEETEYDSKGVERYALARIGDIRCVCARQ